MNELREHSDVVQHLEFCATQSLRTPLRVLQMDGATVSVNVEPPDYRSDPAADPDSMHGCWLPVTKTWQDLGIDLPEGDSEDRETEREERAFTVRFLMAFRAIVEGDWPARERMKLINALSMRGRRWALVARRIAENDARLLCAGGPDLGSAWFASRLANEVEGVGPTLALALFEAGYLTPDEVRAASDDDLLQVPRLGKGTLVKIRMLNASRRR